MNAQALAKAIEELVASSAATQAPPAPTKALYTKREAAETLSMSLSTLDRQIYTGRLKAVKCGHLVRITGQAIADFVELLGEPN